MRARPYLSVIVPVRNGIDVLPQSLSALRDSDMSEERWELIVVDDGSTDETATMAGQYANLVIRLEGKAHGPSYARNRGVERAGGDIVVFIDADVCVHRSTLRRFAELFRTMPDVSAVFGSYDDHPPAPGFVSQYRNLFHHYVHHQNPGDADTFWAGCGAIRKQAFIDVGMYNEWHFSRPQVEDIELGQRLREAGHRIILRPDIQATHLKHWTLASVLKTDLTDRGVPWMRLLIRRGTATQAKSLNLKVVEKVNTMLVALSLVLLVVGLVLWQPAWAFAAGALLLQVVFTNRGMYRWFAKKRGFWFALGVIPLNLAYYVVNAISVWGGIILHHTLGDPQPPVAAEAFAELGVESWPPVPRKAPGSDYQSPSLNVAERPETEPTEPLSGGEQGVGLKQPSELSSSSFNSHIGDKGRLR